MAKLQVKTKNWTFAGVVGTFKQDSHLSKYWMVVVCIFFALVCIGCGGDQETSGVIDFRLNLSVPEVDELDVTVNGGVAVPIERIQWNWGDGRIDKHHFFPASHTYDKPGRYQIEVTVFDSKDRTATKSVAVEIK